MTGVHRERGSEEVGRDSTPCYGAAAAGDGGASSRSLAWRCYALQAAGLVLYIIPIWLQVYIDTHRAAEVSVDALSESHRHWRVRTTLLFLIWSILGGFTLPFGVGWLILIPAFSWYAFRVTRGAARFARGLPVGPAFSACGGGSATPGSAGPDR